MATSAISKKMKIISVGFKMNFEVCRSELMKQISIITDEECDVSKYEIHDEVFSGVWYCSTAPQVYDQRTTDEAMIQWYNSRSKFFDGRIFVRAFYTTPKLIILEAYCGKDNFFVVASNMTKGSATTLHKKNALSGQYGKRYEIPRFEIPATPYIHTI